MNKLSPEEKLTIDSYNSMAKDWVKHHARHDYWEKELEIFKKYLPAGKILEIGCAGGKDAEILIKLGYTYIGIDIASNFVEIAKARNPTGKFEVSSVHDLPYEPNSFDGFWAAAVLLHISKARINETLTKLHKVTKHNSIGFISIKEGIGEEIKEELSSDGNYYNRFWAFYSDDEFREKLAENGFEVLEYIYKPISERTKWLVYFVKNIKE